MTAAVPGRSELVVAAFDLDGTLTEGGSVVRWLSAIAGKSATPGAVLRQSPSLEEVAEASRRFADHHLASNLRTDTKARLDWHLAMGHKVVLVSASPELYVVRVGELVGAHGIVATRLAVDQQGHLTGRYEGKNCRGAEKFSRVTSWMRSEGLLGSSEQAPVLWAYGNSRGDLRLLRAADHGVSCAKLGLLSRLSQFPSLADTVARTASEA